MQAGICFPEPLLRLGVRTALEHNLGMSVVWEGMREGDLARLATELPVDLIVTSADLVPDLVSLSTLTAGAVVLVGGDPLPLQPGPLPAQPGPVLGRVDRGAEPEDLAREIQALLQAAEARGPRRRRARRGAETPLKASLLTPREEDVLAELRVGRTSRETSEELGISVSTVNKHVQHILMKLDARNRTQAALLVPVHVRRLRDAALIEEAVRASAASSDARTLAASLARAACELVGADHAAVAWRGSQGNGLRLLAGDRGTDGASLGIDLRLLALAADRGQSLLLGPTPTPAGATARLADSILCLPLRVGEAIRGVLAVSSHLIRFTPDEAESLQALGEAVAARLDALAQRRPAGARAR